MRSETKNAMRITGAVLGTGIGVAAEVVTAKVIDAALPGAGTGFMKVVHAVGKFGAMTAVGYGVGTYIDDMTEIVIEAIEEAEIKAEAKKLEKVVKVKKDKAFRKAKRIAKEIAE